MHISLQALKAFESAARLGSFKAAAAELAITPTAVSHHIANLESRLNIDLFHREVRKITLTPSGEYLSQNTTSGFKLIFAAIEQLSQAHNQVRITTTSSLAALRLIPALDELYSEKPHLQLDISTSETLDKQLHTLPVRLGNSEEVNKADIIKYERFDMFAANAQQSAPWLDKQVTLYTSQWKNNALPAPPLTRWLKVNNLSDSCFKVKTFDQELFGINQVLANKGVVFCSNTLVQPYLDAGLLTSFNSQDVESKLCYYIPEKSRFETATHNVVIEWLERLLN
ncbi:LysR family transcriptional regulator [Pseudoalteromonas sp. B5MOD-1]|uniref:LysR family transcriptional regulator n=1 Tax=unclassified Pseudoalteromonas TaxID=194690 RepID=UPI001023D896|nr:MULTISPECIES: LysR family transcriptional regulator [unclassified Pseudoalteromonas]NRA77406.1 LysR family transcriptional regulator [Pseudoalteromonas sp.]RZF78545.1 LysR family transcriptional regulator [Pseudoalteromonas sp. CO109Y]TMO35014.1 LysR family transcriptional regulator [Pseudoalteromonas sp. S4491]TMO40994.1 LysR family transcriptional regulator [Pseudoalteromonas sp. S4488]